MNEVASALEQLYDLKEVQRSGWLRVGVTSPETVASHSHLMSLLAILSHEDLKKEFPDMSLERVLMLCTAHDVAESDADVGDITPYDGVTAEEKFNKEAAAITSISRRLAKNILKELWLEFESNQTSNAIIANQLDALDMLLQAYFYKKKQQVDTGEFFASSVTKITSSALRNLLNSVCSNCSNNCI